MGKLERQWREGSTRRCALGRVAALLAGSPLLRAQQDPVREHSRVPGLNELTTAFDFEQVCFLKVPRDAYDYTATGVEDEVNLRRNREAFDWVGLVPKGVVDVSSVDTAAEVLGTKMAFPIMIAPTAGHAQLHPEGEMATHQGATAASSTPMIVSSNASFPIDKISAAAKGPLWYQLYAREDLESNRELLENAQAAGCRAVAVTADSQFSPHRERTLRNRHLSAPAVSRPGSGRRGRAGAAILRYGAAAQTPWLDWRLMEAIRSMVKVPLLAKGILTAEDARLCVEHGVDGIIVSNHGGRYLEYAPSTLEVLPEIVDAVQGKIPVLIDSGFRRGSDVLKALALGARAVCLGRVVRWGLGAYGAPGVQRVLEILQSELVMAMAATGRPALASIDRTLVQTDWP
jgi:4-hydroxymandelate oxidase